MARPRPPRTVDRLSGTVPSELGAALRALAERRGESVSAIAAEAIAHQVRLAALDDALDDADRRSGPVPDEMIEKALAERLSMRNRTNHRTRRRAG